MLYETFEKSAVKRFPDGGPRSVPPNFGGYKRQISAESNSRNGPEMNQIGVQHFITLTSEVLHSYMVQLEIKVNMAPPINMLVFGNLTVRNPYPQLGAY